MLLILKLSLIAFCHVAAQIFLYAGRVAKAGPAFHSDLLVFGVPFFAALISYVFFFFRSFVLSSRPPITRSVVLILLEKAMGVNSPKIKI